jgi:hypothetical protein
MAVMMILCVVLEVAAAYNLIFALCARLGRTNYLILLLSVCYVQLPFTND